MQLNGSWRNIDILNLFGTEAFFFFFPKAFWVLYDSLIEIVCL